MLVSFVKSEKHRWRRLQEWIISNSISVSSALHILPTLNWQRISNISYAFLWVDERLKRTRPIFCNAWKEFPASHSHLSWADSRGWGNGRDHWSCQPVSDFLIPCRRSLQGQWQLPVIFPFSLLSAVTPLWVHTYQGSPSPAVLLLRPCWQGHIDGVPPN